MSGTAESVRIAAGMKWEFDQAGIGWEPFSARAERLRATIEALGREFAADGYAQQAPLRDEFGIPVLRPVQRRGFGGHGPPLIVGGTGDRILQVAAEHADIVSVAGAFQIKGQPPDDADRYCRRGRRAGALRPRMRRRPRRPYRVARPRPSCSADRRSSGRRGAARAAIRQRDVNE